MRLSGLIVALLLLAAPAFAGESEGKGAPPPAPIVGPRTPFSDMMIDVQRLQARMAVGDKAAYDESRARMRAIGAAIAASGPEAFRVKTERDAVVVYLLSGGQPRDIARIDARGDFPATERDLLRGAAGYAAGRQAEAEKLVGYEPKTQSLRLASQLAYAQSVLLAEKNAKKALDLLDLARLLAPGSLIEEAALRREILLVGDLRDPERVGFLARQYVERFGGSLYAGDFVRSLTATAIRYDLCATPANLAKFSELLHLMAPAQARAFLLSVARASVTRDRFDVGAKAAEAALATAAAGSSDEARARLYDLLSRATELTADAAEAASAQIAAGKLAPADRNLLAAASYMLAHLRDPPPLSAYAENWREASVAAARSPDLAENGDTAASTIRRAIAAVGAAETLVGAGRAP